MAIERTGPEEIQQGYEMYKKYPYYALFEGPPNGRGEKTGRLIFAYTGDDMAGEGWDLLQQNLSVLQANSPTTPCILQFYSELNKRGDIDTNTPYAGSFKLRMQKAAERMMPAISGIGQDTSFLTYLQNELRFEKEKNLELQNELDDLKEENEQLQKSNDAPGVGGVIGQIGEVGNAFPWMADIIKDWTTIAKHKIIGGSYREPAAAGGIGRVDPQPDPTAPPDQRINGAIKKMVAWYIKEYGGPGTEEERKVAGFKAFAADMQLLASLTNDDDIMHLALKKLRSLE